MRRADCACERYKRGVRAGMRDFCSLVGWMALRQVLQRGKQVLAPVTSAGQWYAATAKKHPFPTAFFTSGIKTSFADFIAQKVSYCTISLFELLHMRDSLTISCFAFQVVEKKEDFDWTRHAAFVCFGFCYLGGVQYYLYNIKFVQWCGGITAQVGHVGVAPLKTFMDQFIQ